MLIDIQWPLVLFGILCGMGGTLACSIGVAELMGRARQARFVASIVSLAFMVVGGLAVVAHLSMPLNAFYAVAHVFSFSGISVELIMLVITFVVMLVYAILLKRDVAPGAFKVLAVLAIVSGLVLAFVCGHGYVIQSREYWDTELLPLAYMGTVLPAGAFLHMALSAKLGVALEELKGMKVYLVVAVAASIVTSAAYLLFLGDAVGRNSLVSYGMIVVCGMVGEFVCLAAFLKAPNANTVFLVAVVAVVLAVVAALGIRIEMWLTSDPYFNAFYWELENGAPILKDDY